MTDAQQHCELIRSMEMQASAASAANWKFQFMVVCSKYYARIMQK